MFPDAGRGRLTLREEKTVIDGDYEGTSTVQMMHDMYVRHGGTLQQESTRSTLQRW